MAGTAGRTGAIIVLSVFGLAAGARPAAAQVTPHPARVVSSPNTASTSPRISFHPATGQYGIAYREPGPRRWVGGFLDQDGNRLTAPIGVLSDNGYEAGLRDVLPFPFSTATLATFQAYGYDAFGNNVFVGDAAGVAFAGNGLASGLVNYTNSGGDKSVANNCGEHEEMGASAADPSANRFFMSYSQLFHYYDNGSCRTSGSTLMAAYHQNSLPFAFSNGPWPVENGAGAQDAVFNPGTGQIWLGFASALKGRLSIALVTPAGVNAIVPITAGGDNITRGDLHFAVHPGTNNVLAVWSEYVNFEPTVRARLFSPNGGALTADIPLSNPATERILRSYVAAQGDHFFVAGFIQNHVIGRALTPAGAIASEWTRLDDVKDQWGNPVNVNNGVDLAANPVRGTYGVVFDSFSDIYFVEVAVSAGMTLTVTVDGTGAGAVTSNPPGVNCPGTCSMTVAAGTSVELIASPANFSDFTGWGGACAGAAACTVTLDAPAHVTATFTRQRFPLTVTTIGEGVVTSSPSGIECGAACSAAFDANSDVELTATAAAGWRFTGWSGACSGTGACVVHVLGAESVTATFARQFTLTVTTAGNGGGQVDGGGIGCPGASCAITVDAGTAIALTASPDATSRFSGWSGDCAGDGACAVTVSNDMTVDAVFIRQFDVEAAVNGSGGILSDPAGIDCPGDCTGRFDTGSSVVLTASAAAGWRFAGWSGDAACTGTGTCTLAAAEYRVAEVAAAFVQQFALDVAMSGTGGGSVSGPDISCPGDCSQTYDAGTVITLAAAPDAASIFTGWSGACSGVGACEITLAGAVSVTATFTARQFPLTVTLAGSGSGSVTSNPAGISCGATCTAGFDAGTLVTLTAAAAPSSSFAGWSGACTGTGACVVTLSEAQSVTATFEASTIASVSAEVAALATTIGAGPVNSVTGKLTNAEAAAARGNTNAAANQLNAAINEINALVKSRRLDPAIGAALVAELRAIIGGLVGHP